jgi:cysteine-rich repeat protein
LAQDGTIRGRPLILRRVPQSTPQQEEMRTVVRFWAIRVVALAVAVALPVRAHALISNVDEATDICSADADPCLITQVVQLNDNAVLDFGVRAVEVIGAGRIDAPNADFTLMCGKLRLATGTNVAMSLKGTTSNGSAGGIVNIRVQRRCSEDTSIKCINDLNCATADAGICSFGNGNVEIGGRIAGSADDPAVITILAAGNIDVFQQIQVNSSSVDNDGGSIDLESGGTVTIEEKLQAISGGLGTGGEICLVARDDVIVNDVMDASGGDFDGGFIEIDAGRDVKISEDISGSSIAGGGFGGEITVDADRDIIIVGGTAANRLTLQTNGHQASIEGVYGGDGGIQDYYAGRDVRVGPFVVNSATGAPPDGYGEEVTLDAGRDVLAEGDMDCKAHGIYGSGGYATFFSNGKTTITSTASFDLTAPDGGGQFSAEADGPIVFAGVVDATTAADASGGRIEFFSSQDDLTISGDVSVNGEFAGGTCKNTSECSGNRTQICTTNADCDQFEVCTPRTCSDKTFCPIGDTCVAFPVTYVGCDVHFTAGALSDNDVGAGNAQTVAHATTRVTAREKITVDSGAQILTSANGFNVFRYRSTAPTIQGTVSPAAQNVVLLGLLACPVCGNAQVEQGESCDDGNVGVGDGCNASCQDEGCIAQTPGWPTAELCDDEMHCTVDICDDATHTCSHVEECDDGGSCSTDYCSERGECLHVPHDDQCNDNIDCTHDTCSGAGQCVFRADHLLCADAFACTIDKCIAGQGCTYLTDNTKCNDANLCTTDHCVVGTGCENAPNTNPCNDGVGCTVGDVCTAGACKGTDDCPEGEVCDLDLNVCGAPTTTTTPTTTVPDPTTTTIAGPTTTTLPAPTTTTVPVPTTTTLPGPTTTLAPTTTAEPPASTSTTTSTVPTTTLPATTTTVLPTTTTLPAPECGNSQVEDGEECDPGFSIWAPGNFCHDCAVVECGDSDDSGTKSASDALFALRAAVKTVECDCVCDVNNSNSITASDALTLLRKAVGVNVALTCPCTTN